MSLPASSSGVMPNSVAYAIHQARSTATHAPGSGFDPARYSVITAIPPWGGIGDRCDPSPGATASRCSTAPQSSVAEATFDPLHTMGVSGAATGLSQPSPCRINAAAALAERKSTSTQRSCSPNSVPKPGIAGRPSAVVMPSPIHQNRCSCGCALRWAAVRIAGRTGSDAAAGPSLSPRCRCSAAFCSCAPPALARAGPAARIAEARLYRLACSSLIAALILGAAWFAMEAASIAGAANLSD
jgi:hypothetical protein